MSAGDTDQLPHSRLTGAFERRVGRELDAHVPADATTVVACSGGPDSTAVLVAVARARGGRGGAVTAACFDHGLRPPAETALDRAAVESVARRLGVRAVGGSAPERPATEGGGGAEAAARNARYRWLAGVCGEASAGWCITGHTLDDQAETVLLRLARGTGTAGVAAMASGAPWPLADCGEGLSIVRPLLGTRRAAVAAYLGALGLESRSDPTNELTVFDRNRVRHRVLPELRAINPRAEEALSRFAALARRDDEALEGWARREAEQIVSVGVGAALVRRRPLLELPPAVASRVLRTAAQRVGLVLDAAQVAQLLRVARRYGARLSLSGGDATVLEEELRLGRPTGGRVR